MMDDKAPILRCRVTSIRDLQIAATNARDRARLHGMIRTAAIPTATSGAKMFDEKATAVPLRPIAISVDLEIRRRDIVPMTVIRRPFM